MMKKTEAPERIWAARELISNGELAGPFNVPPHLRHLCVEYVRADSNQREIEQLRAALYGVARRVVLEIDGGHCWCDKPIKPHTEACLAARAALTPKEGE